MAALEKLAIRGIRSFDDKQICVIEFYNPVTVIVGQNGSGKTTIIECLKYVTTGDQPPNTKGGAFIHDPKMANEKEVKAQVKLRFNAANGRRMLAIRNLSVTLKKNNAMTMKTLENILAIDDMENVKGGKRGVLSTKCAEIDSEIPHLLGVSKSVLENVIFCHQEDSYWPLAEASVLKKKFDDIFEATKYTKALDNIKGLRKDRVAELKVDKERLESLHADKTRADKLKARVKQLTTSIAQKEEDCRKLGELYHKWVSQNQRLEESATRFRETFIQLEGLDQRREMLEKDLKDSTADLEELSDDDETLTERMGNFSKHVDQLRDRARRKRIDLEREEAEQVQSRELQVKLIQEQARLEAERGKYEKNLELRKTSANEIANKYSISGFQAITDSEDDVQEFRDKLSALMRQRKNRVAEVKRELSTEMTQLRDKLANLERGKNQLKDRRDNFRATTATRSKEVKDAEREIDDTEHLVTDMSSISAEFKDKESDHERASNEMTALNFAQRSQELATQISELEGNRKALNEELAQISGASDLRVKLDLLRDDVKRKDTEILTGEQSCNAKFRRLTGLNQSPDNRVKAIQEHLSVKSQSCKELQARSDEAKRAMDQHSSSLSTYNEQLKQKRAALLKLQSSLKAELDSDTTVSAAFEEATTELNIRKGNLGTLHGTNLIYETILRHGQSKGICTACKRPMNPDELATFVNNMTEQMQKTSPEALASNEKEANEWQAELTRLQSLLSDESHCERLRKDDIPSLEAELKDLISRQQQVSDAATEQSGLFDETRQEVKEFEALLDQEKNVDILKADVRRIKSDMVKLEERLSSSGSIKNPDDIKDEFDQLSGKIQKLTRQQHSLSQERDRLSARERDVGEALHKLTYKKQELQNKLHLRENVELNLVKIRQETHELSSKIKEMDGELKDRQHPLDAAAKDLEKHERETSHQIFEAEERLDELKQSIEKFQSLDQTIDEYTRGGSARQLRRTESDAVELKNRITEAQSVINQTRETLADIDRQLGQSDSSILKMRENVRVRTLRQNLEECRVQIAAIDIEGAAAAKEEYSATWNKAKDREVQAQSDYASAGGEIGSLKEQLKVLKEDQVEYKDIQKRYNDHLIKVKMSEMANDDLDKYGKALDSAIMKYHSLKMGEVNDTMEYLWHKTYQGTDIDAIKIRSDNEGAANKRSYNYRVVMTKDQVEMDMRGRCSAGQKMLASIIIRLALADSFSQNCGILALDEPTNALDTENVEALANSLIDIINERKHIANFQLIIITHDETFLRRLSTHGVMEFYWRVSRDSHQKSMISRQRATA